MLPILTTGSPRSGTTWTGQILKASPEIGFIMEPFFHISHRPGICASKFHALPYLPPHGGEEHVKTVERMLRFDYDVWRGITGSRSPRDWARMARDIFLWRMYRKKRVRPLVKDPSALFLSEWLAARFGVTPIVMIRHPAAVISSLKMLGWRVDFSKLIHRPDLERQLAPFRAPVEKLLKREADLIDEAILFWNILHSWIAHLRETYPTWIFIKHEELSTAPVREFGHLFERLGLRFDDAIRSRINEYCGSKNPSDATKQGIPVQRTKSLRRDSGANLTNWKRRLSPEEIARIHNGTAEVSAQFYGEETWD